MEILDSLAWPLARLGEALETLARHHGLSPRPGAVLVPPQGLAEEALGHWMVAAAAGLGLEVEPVTLPTAEVEPFVRHAGPTLLRLSSADEPRFLVLLGSRRWAVALLGPDHTIHRCRPAWLAATLCQAQEAPLRPEVDALLAAAGVPRRRQARVRTSLLRERLRDVPLGGSWQVDLLPGASIWRQVRQAGLLRLLVTLVSAHTIQYGLWLLAWGLLGQGVLQGRVDPGWLLAWGLLLLTLIPLQGLATWTQGRLVVGAGALLKRRLLAGAMRLAPDEIR